MNEVLHFPPGALFPKQVDVLAHQGVPPGTQIRPDIEEICSDALRLLNETMDAVGVTSEISLQDFAAVFEGEGENDPETPVGEISEQSDHLLLFAVTLGAEMSKVIDELFHTNEFPLGCMLDAAASVAADAAAEVIEQRFARSLTKLGWSLESGAALRYSPGYCGWHISGQKKLFEYLQPEQVGLTLRDSYLMEPLKSVSGVVLAGPKEIHEFDPSFPCCSTCETYYCRDRIRALFAG